MNPWENIENLSAGEIRALQNRRLKFFINSYLYPFSTHYKNLLDRSKVNPRSIRTVEDLARIPLTSKKDFLDTEAAIGQFKDFILRPDEEKIRRAWPVSKLIPLALTKLCRGSAFVKENLEKEFRPVFMTFTTGTTNKPVPFLYTNYDIDNLRLFGSRMLKLFKTESSEHIVNIFPFAPHLAFWQVVFGGLAANTLVLSTGGGKILGTEGNIGAILKMKPSVILGVPGYVYHLVRTAKEKGCDFSFIKTVVLGASRITIPFKKKLSELLEEMGSKNVSVIGTYGFTEARCAWAECPASLDISSGYHLYPDKEIFEIVDPQTGEVKREGEDGEIVYTSLDARGSCVLRFRTGDFVHGGITCAPCPYCQRTTPRISSDITRLSDIKDLHLSKIKGALVNLNNFAACLSEIPQIEEWQIEIGKKNNDPFDIDELVVYAASQGTADRKELEEEIKKKIAAATEVTPNRVQFIELGEMVKRLELETANKEKRIIDKRPKE